MNYYYLFIFGMIEPEVLGPFDTEDEMLVDMENKKRENGTCKHGYFPFKMTKNAEIEMI